MRARRARLLIIYFDHKLRTHLLSRMHDLTTLRPLNELAAQSLWRPQRDFCHRMGFSSDYLVIPLRTSCKLTVAVEAAGVDATVVGTYC